MQHSATDREQEQNPGETWLTPGEIAQELKLPDERVRVLLSAGELEHLTVAGEQRVKRSVLSAYLTRSTRPARAQRRWPKRFGVVLGLGALSGLLLLATMLNAQGPLPASEVIPYHGYLEEDGLAVEGRKYLTFCLTRLEADTACAWTENHIVEVAGGRFAVELGTVNSLDTLLAGSGSLYIGITVDDVTASDLPAGTPVALAGKQLLGSVPFARRGSPGENFVVDGVLSSSSLNVSSSGTVAQNMSVGNQLTAKQLNLNGRILFSGVQRFCMYATSCPADWADVGQAGFILNGPCPFAEGSNYGGVWNWCHPRLCCN